MISDSVEPNGFCNPFFFSISLVVIHHKNHIPGILDNTKPWLDRWGGLACIYSHTLYTEPSHLPVLPLSLSAGGPLSCGGSMLYWTRCWGSWRALPRKKNLCKSHGIILVIHLSIVYLKLSASFSWENVCFHVPPPFIIAHPFFYKLNLNSPTDVEEDYELGPELGRGIPLINIRVSS